MNEAIAQDYQNKTNNVRTKEKKIKSKEEDNGNRDEIFRHGSPKAEGKGY